MSLFRLSLCDENFHGSHPVKLFYCTQFSQHANILKICSQLETLCLSSLSLMEKIAMSLARRNRSRWVTLGFSSLLPVCQNKITFWMQMYFTLLKCGKWASHIPSVNRHKLKFSVPTIINRSSTVPSDLGPTRYPRPCRFFVATLNNTSTKPWVFTFVTIPKNTVWEQTSVSSNATGFLITLIMVQREVFLLCSGTKNTKSC